MKLPLNLPLPSEAAMVATMRVERAKDALIARIRTMPATLRDYNAHNTAQELEALLAVLDGELADLHNVIAQLFANQGEGPL
ncbi:MAG: hypothetical protein NVS1B6_20000 [Steroidobacteraceae bacterium]